VFFLTERVIGIMENVQDVAILSKAAYVKLNQESLIGLMVNANDVVTL